MPAYSEFIEDTPNLKIEKPYVTYPGLPIPKSNVVHKEYVLPNLTDVRTLAAKEKPTFDENGLVYLQHKSAAADALVSKDEQGPYWDEVTALLKAFLGVETVFPYALKVRACVLLQIASRTWPLGQTSHHEFFTDCPRVRAICADAWS